MLLTIELIPTSAWGKNLRLLPREIWDPVRRAAYRKANYRCEVCSGVGPQHPVDCHEVWSYCLQGLPPRKVQKLVGVVALCPDCHAVKHMGRTGVVHGRAVAKLALGHLADVNGWTLAQAEEHRADAFERWRVRDEFFWEVDLTLVGGGRIEADQSCGDSYERTFGGSRDLSARLQSQCDAWHRGREGRRA